LPTAEWAVVPRLEPLELSKLNAASSVSVAVSASHGKSFLHLPSHDLAHDHRCSDHAVHRRPRTETPSPGERRLSEATAFLADLPPILERLGNRGYRAAQLEAAIRAGKIYLAAYAQRLGATGLTFYDDEVTAFFSPHAAGKSVMFLMALGQPARRRERSGA
jgi:hypothetical protein